MTAISRSALALTVLGLASGAPAGAQVWSLPEPTATSSTPSVQGPVDAQNPQVRPLPEETPAPLQSAAPAVKPSSATPRTTPGAAPTPRPVVTPKAQAPSTPKQASPLPERPPQPSAAASEERETPAAVPASDTPPATTIATDSPPAVPEQTQPGTELGSLNLAQLPLPILAGIALALLVVIGGFFLLRRRRHTHPEPAHSESPASTAPAPASPPQPEAPAAMPAQAPTPPTPPAPASPAPAPSQPRAEAHGEISFEPLSLQLSSDKVALRFRFTITALTEIPPLRLHADMIGAHGTADTQAQLYPSLDALPSLGTIPYLKPGQKVDFEAEMQLPLSAIRPVRDGNAEFFVPLVRLAMAVDTSHADYFDDLPHLELGMVFTIGQPAAGAPDRTRALAPLRIDTGPRDFSPLDAREIAAGRRKSLFPLDSRAMPV